MKLNVTVKETRQIEVDALRVVLPVNYEEEDMPNDFPGREGNSWTATIDLATGKIIGWRVVTAPLDLQMKVVDGGCYYLLSAESVVAKVENDYVPDGIPGEYGDYINFKIDGNGNITNWASDFDAKAVQSSFFKDTDE